jgi:hypothetical protein
MVYVLKSGQQYVGYDGITLVNSQKDAARFSESSIGRPGTAIRDAIESFMFTTMPGVRIVKLRQRSDDPLTAEPSHNGYDDYDDSPF